MNPTSVTVCLGNSHPTRDLAKYTSVLQVLLKCNYTYFTTLPNEHQGIDYFLQVRVCLSQEVSNTNRPPRSESNYAILS
jgi:hypothetical protein